METGGIGDVGPPKPVSANPRPDQSVGGVSAPSELAPAAAVTAVRQPESVQLDLSPPSHAAAALDASIRGFIEQHLTVDPKTREVVYQAKDARTGEVVRQVPDEAILRLRAYVREMCDAEKATSPADGQKIQKIA